MFAKVINYTDYDGNERSETYYFNLTKAELTEMEMSEDGGLSKMLKAIVDEQNAPKIMAFFKEFILRSYGEKTNDGKRFIKVRDGHKLSDDFSQTEAYSELFMELATDADKATAFINGVVPKIENAPAQLPAAGK